MRDFIVNSVFPPRRCVSSSSGERRNLLSAFDDLEPSTSTSTYNTPVMDNTRETDLFDLPMTSQPYTLPKLFSLNTKIVNNEPPIAIESEEDDEGKRISIMIFPMIFPRIFPERQTTKDQEKQNQ